MEKLFIETQNGNVPIAKNVIESQNIKKGMFSPFTRNRIVGENNDFPTEKPIKNSKEGFMNEDPEATENVMLSTSEVIDFAEGLDSRTEQ